MAYFLRIVTGDSNSQEAKFHGFHLFRRGNIVVTRWGGIERWPGGQFHWVYREEKRYATSSETEAKIEYRRQATERAKEWTRLPVGNLIKKRRMKPQEIDRRLLRPDVPMLPRWHEAIWAAQKDAHLTMGDGRCLPLIRYGDEHWISNADKESCYDCGVVKGQYHVGPNCAVEQCPSCGEQLVQCDCLEDEGQSDENEDIAAGPAVKLEPGSEAGEQKTIELAGGAELELVWVPGGTYEMGASSEDGEASDDEKPWHKVKLAGYWLGKYPVTQEQWKSVMGENPSYFKGVDRPVEKVSWNGCQKFLRKAGEGLRLPTEAEWEVACRARTKDSRYGELREVAWYTDNSDYETHPVGKKKANRWRLHDMLGNVSEWCQDAYRHDAYKDRKGVTESPVVEGDSRAERVLRGNDWQSEGDWVRASARSGLKPSFQSSGYGFRVACSPSREPAAS